MGNIPLLQMSNPQKSTLITVALSLLVASTGVELLLITHHLVTSPISVLDTFSNRYVLGSTLAGAVLGAFITLLWYLYPKSVSKARLWCLGLLNPLCNTVSMLRSGLDSNRIPLSTVLSFLGVGLMLRAGTSYYRTTSGA